MKWTSYMHALSARVLLILILLIPITTSSEAQSEKERANLRVWVKLDEKWGLIDGNEQWIVEPYYANCTSVINDLAIVTFSEDSAKGEKELRKHAVINDKGETILEFEAIGAEFLETFETIVFETETGKGCMNLKGEVLVEPVYEAVREDHSDNTRFLVRRGKKWGLFTAGGEVLTQNLYDRLEVAHINRYIVTKEGKSGVVNERNEVVVNLDFGSIRGNSRTTFFDEIYQYPQVWAFTDSINLLIDLHDGLVKIKSKANVPAVTDEIDWIPYINNGRKGYIDYEGNMLLELDSGYTDVYYFSDDRALVRKNATKRNNANPFPNEVFGVINKQGKEIVNGYDFMTPFINGLAACLENGKYGYIDIHGEVKVPFKYDEAEFFYKNGLAAVVKEGKYGMVNSRGEEIIEPKFTQLEDIRNGDYYIVGNHGMYGVLDKQGASILSMRYQAIQGFRSMKYNFM